MTTIATAEAATATAAATAGEVVVEKVDGRSAATKCFSRYPLKLVVSKKVVPASADAVWIYSLTYGGGIVSGDKVPIRLSVRDGCTAVMTTQSSTKVYKALGAQCSEQYLEAVIGEEALLAILPDPVTCFANARYFQKQVFRGFSNSNIVVVDWLTSGRHEIGEKWAFELYKSTNHIFLEDQPVFLDTVLLEQRSSIEMKMHKYHVFAMIIILGPKLKSMQNQLQEEIKETMAVHFRPRTAMVQRRGKPSNLSNEVPPFIVSCSTFGPKAAGVVTRIAATTTEAVYVFLSRHLAALEPLLGASPYHLYG